MEADFFKKRLIDLANRSFNTNSYTFTDFLTLAEISDFYDISQELRFANPVLFGGIPSCERKMIRFGSPEELGYEEPFPIVAIRIKPLIEKFSDDLSHRDFLGSLMNLGIEREMLGDIIVNGNEAYVFCKETMASYVMENLVRIRHTSVVCEIVEEVVDEIPVNLSEITMSVASIRADLVVSKVYNLSRNASAEAFTSRKVYINGRLCENVSYMLKEGDVVSIRGFGRFVYNEAGGISKKGKQYITISKYV